MWDPKWFASAHAKLHAHYSRNLAGAAVVAVACTGLGTVFAPPYVPAPYVLPPQPVIIKDIIHEIDVPERVPDIPLPVFTGEIDPFAEGEEIETIPIQPDDWTKLRPSAPPGPEDFVVRPEVPPTLVHAQSPVYPDMARRIGAQGRVLVELVIDEDGRVIAVKIAESNAIESLERAAMDAAWGFLFAPARQGDKPVRTRVVVPFDFHLGS